MNDRFLKWTGVLAAVAIVSGALVVTANAHLGVSHSQTTSQTTSGTSAASPTESDGTATTTTTSTVTVTTTATAGDPRDRRSVTTLTILYARTAGAFRGMVGNRSKRCQRGRLVTLEKHRPGPNRRVGMGTSNRSGNWKIRKRVRPGRFYAIVAEKTFTNRTGGTTVCLRDKSVTVRVRAR